MLAAALPHYRRFADPESPGGGAAALSIAAGWRLAGFAQVLGADTPVVRAMPNTPAAVGRGMTVLCANAKAGAELRDTDRKSVVSGKSVSVSVDLGGRRIIKKKKNKEYTFI